MSGQVSRVTVIASRSDAAVSMRPHSLQTQIKRVIQGEAAGDLVLEEDLKRGGAGIPIGQEGIGAGLDGLKDGRRPKGPYVSRLQLVLRWSRLSLLLL